MKNSNDRKIYQSPEKQENADKRNNPEASQISIGLASEGYKNTTGSDDDIPADIQDTIGRDVTLSPAASNKSKNTTRRIPW